MMQSIPKWVSDVRVIPFVAIGWVEPLEPGSRPEKHHAESGREGWSAEGDTGLIAFKASPTTAARSLLTGA